MVILLKVKRIYFFFNEPAFLFWYRTFFFFLVGYATLKDFSCLFGAKFPGRKFYHRGHDNHGPMGQSVIFHAAPNTAYVNHFFPREFIIRFKSIQVKQVDLETSSLSWLLGVCTWPHELKLASHTFKSFNMRGQLVARLPFSQISCVLLSPHLFCATSLPSESTG